MKISTRTDKCNVLLLSGYDAVSHKLWRERLQLCLPDWEWTILKQPPRHFTYRLRSNALHWAASESEILNAFYDLIIATSMVDLSALRGLVPNLTQIPTVLYFHENQFAYPAGRQRKDNIEPLLVPIYSAVCSDLILFNSQFNRQSFLQGVNELSRDLPEPFPQAILNRLNQSEVLPVPLPAWPPRTQTTKQSDYLDVIWNHRWEYDKGPGLLLAIINQCWSRKLPIKFHVVGQQFREQPSEFEEIASLLRQIAQHFNWHVGQLGYIEDFEDYKQLLYSADIVLSTALHDFQGLAIQEACIAGCYPLTPQTLAYPEYLPQENLYPVLGTNDDTASQVVEKLQVLLQKKRTNEIFSVPVLDEFRLEVIAKRYEKLLSSVKTSGVGIA